MEGSNKGKRTIITASVIAFLAVALIVYFLVIPSIRKVFQSKDSLEEKKLTLEQMRKDIGQREKYQELKLKIEKDKDLLASATMKEDNLIKLIEKLESISQLTGNKVTIEVYTPPKKKKTVTAVEDETTEKKAATPSASTKAETKDLAYLLLTVEGDYDQFLSYLYSLENISHPIKVESVDIKVREGTIIDLANSTGAGDNESGKRGQTEGRVIISFTKEKNK